MARIMAIDFGMKRVGIAVTDIMQMIASPLETIDTSHIYTYLEDYFSREQVEKVIVGWPTDLQGRDTDVTEQVRKFCQNLETKFPDKQVIRWDERFTSKIASQAISQSGMGKMKRRDKNLIDKISASLILQSYMGI